MRRAHIKKKKYGAAFKKLKNECHDERNDVHDVYKKIL